MNAWRIILCFLLVVEGNRTLFDQKRALCIFNAIREEYFNCIPTKVLSFSQMRWNSTLEYYSNVYSRQMCMGDLNIPDEIDFTESNQLTYAHTELVTYDRF
ncbi:hypothetical protein PHET_06521 [Paragonimus heterotremus]|uniref:Uncharacterized protein n=1 Tax=Paragonimus heterotremus TaxID=100268 RepID=A0A8J4WYT8_9TREM|nr:hypothetical protein PHET_06521 [Paragonimus heterotremus]